MKNGIKIIFFMLLIAAIIVVAVNGRKEVSKREHESLITVGTITKRDNSAKTNYYIAYSFNVSGVDYFGSMPVKFCKECDKPCCEIGAKVKVRYEKANPANNDLIH